MKLLKTNIQYFISNKSLVNNKQLSFYSGSEDKLNMKSSFSNKDIFLKNLSEKKQKECIMGKNCPFLKKYILLKNEVKGLITSINKIKKINEFLSQSLLNKSKLYQCVLDENENLKKEYYYLEQRKNHTENSNIKNDILSLTQKPKINKKIQQDSYHGEKKKFINLKLKSSVSRNKNGEKLKKIFFNSISNEKNNIDIYKNTKNNNLQTINSLISPKKENRKPSDLNINILHNNKKNKNFNDKIYRNINLINNKNPEIYYDLIYKYTKQQKPKFISDKMKRSFLSHNIDFETLIKNNNPLIKLSHLTKSEENFLSIINSSSDENLLKYFDMINYLITDYKDILELGIRMKSFIKNSILLVESIIDNNSIKVLIEITCKILACDRASLFILDKISDSLIVYSGEGIKKAQIKVPKDKGIVGACFMDMKKIRIDNAYLDKRFNTEIDKKTNYKTRSILCYPLVDRHGECFGVIEAINKLIPPFNIDDEELIKLLSYQANIIFKSLNTYDDNRYLSLKLIIIINYNIIINNIYNKFDITEKTEDTLLNIFDCMISKFYFVENDKIVHYSKGEKGRVEFDINIGIIGKVAKLKDILGYQSIKNSVEYNSLIDIDSSDGLLTFPILEIQTKKIKGVIQIPYIGKIYKNGKPKDVEVNLIKKFRKCIKYWIKKNNF